MGLYLDHVGTIRSDVGTKCSPYLGLFQCSHCTQSNVTAAMLQYAVILHRPGLVYGY